MTAFGKRRKEQSSKEQAVEDSGEMDPTNGSGDGTATAPANGADVQDETATDPAASTEPKSDLEIAISERDEARDRALRAQADYQNLRRRTQADIDAAVLRAKSDVLGEAVTVLDYLDMALAAPVESEDAKNLKIGIEMTRGQLQALFDRLAIKPIVAAGVFDATLHQAVSTVETDEHEPGTIVEVVRGGWSMGESVLRFAQVRVAAAPEPETEPEDGDVIDVAANQPATESDESSEAE